MPLAPLTSDKLYRTAALNGLSDACKSTKHLTPLDEIVGQERAQHAVEFAMSIKEKGYNIYEIGRASCRERV